MDNRLFLHQLTLVGSEKNYIVPFKEGLNFITGPTSTGKSSILEMINYSFGSSRHKDYIEIRQRCSAVQLEFSIGIKRFKVIRPLFDYKRPVKLYRWNEEESKYTSTFDLLDVEQPSADNSLSTFLLKELGIHGIKVVNQDFSFRDLYKYCYVQQTDIDSENLLHEQFWGPSIKRKPTFEIILNIYDSLIGDLKNNAKEQRELISEKEKKRDSIGDFLKNLDLLSIDKYHQQRQKLLQSIGEKKHELEKIKTSGKSVDDVSVRIEDSLLQLRGRSQMLQSNIQDRETYNSKLVLLRNQYESDVERIEFILEGAVAINCYDFAVCPSCLNEIVRKPNVGECSLCGSQMKNLSDEEQQAFRHELRRLKIKSKSVNEFVHEQEFELENLRNESDTVRVSVRKLELRLDELRKAYVNPFIEQIETINFEVGRLTQSLEELETNLSVMSSFTQLVWDIEQHKKTLENLNQHIKDLEANVQDKGAVIAHLSKRFSNILESFTYPKLANAFIDGSNYLPYVRDRKYSDLGGGGSVTMITMAYFLSIALDGTVEGKNHPGLLIIDSPRKNLGAESQVEDFKDERIFNNIIKTFIASVQEPEHRLQLIVVNNGYPSFLEDVSIIVEYDGDGTQGLPYGLIDDLI